MSKKVLANNTSTPMDKKIHRMEHVCMIECSTASKMGEQAYALGREWLAHESALFHAQKALESLHVHGEGDKGSATGDRVAALLEALQRLERKLALAIVMGDQ